MKYISELPWQARTFGGNTVVERVYSDNTFTLYDNMDGTFDYHLEGRAIFDLDILEAQCLLNHLTEKGNHHEAPQVHAQASPESLPRPSAHHTPAAQTAQDA